MVVLDQQGRAIGVSQEMRCTTRRGELDIFTSSSGKNTFHQKFPDWVGQKAANLEIFHGDESLGGAALRKRIDEAAKIGAAMAAFL